MDRGRTEGEQRVTEEFADAVRDQAMHFFSAMMEEVRQEIRRNPEAFRLAREPLSQQEADRLALDAVHRAREELGRTTEDRPPGDAAIERWVRDREEERSRGRLRYWRR